MSLLCVVETQIICAGQQTKKREIGSDFNHIVSGQKKKKHTVV